MCNIAVINLGVSENNVSVEVGNNCLKLEVGNYCLESYLQVTCSEIVIQKKIVRVMTFNKMNNQSYFYST